MAGLDTMYNNGMGSLASLRGGQQLVADREMGVEKLREARMINDQNAVMNPLNAQFKQGQIDQQSAELPGVQAKSSEATETLASNIAAKLSANATQIGTDGMVKMGQEGEKVLKISQMLSQYPPAMHKQVLQAAWSKFGGVPDSPMIQGLLQTPDGEVQKNLATLGTGLAMASSKYLQESVQAGNLAASNEKIHKANNDTQIQVAQIQAAAKQAVAATRVQATKHMNMDQAITYLEMQEDRSPEEEQQLRNLKTQRLTERAAGANNVAPTILDQPTNMDRARQEGQRGAPQAPPAAPQKAAIPAGYKQVGTSKGVPVLEGPDGKRFLWNQ